jgi:hypothetical protein
MKYPVKSFAKSMTDNPSTYLLVLVNSATASNMWHVPYEPYQKRKYGLEVYPNTSPTAAPV